MNMRASGVRNPVEIQSKKLNAADAPFEIEVGQDAHTHQVAIDALDGTAGTASVTVLPVGMVDEQPLYEADGSTPVVLTLVPGDSRSDIRGSLQRFTFTLAGFDGTEVKVSVTSWF